MVSEKKILVVLNCFGQQIFPKYCRDLHHCTDFLMEKNLTKGSKVRQHSAVYSTAVSLIFGI